MVSIRVSKTFDESSNLSTPAKKKSYEYGNNTWRRWILVSLLWRIHWKRGIGLRRYLWIASTWRCIFWMSLLRRRFLAGKLRERIIKRHILLKIKKKFVYLQRSSLTSRTGWDARLNNKLRYDGEVVYPRQEEPQLRFWTILWKKLGVLIGRRGRRSP